MGKGKIVLLILLFNVNCIKHVLDYHHKYERDIYIVLTDFLQKELYFSMLHQRVHLLCMYRFLLLLG
jgi:hypothetical protein